MFAETSLRNVPTANKIIMINDLKNKFYLIIHRDASLLKLNAIQKKLKKRLLENILCVKR